MAPTATNKEIVMNIPPQLDATGILKKRKAAE
jgi:hypothetical protein